MARNEFSEQCRERQLQEQQARQFRASDRRFASYVKTLCPDPLAVARKLRTSPDQQAIDDAITVILMLSDKHAQALGVLDDLEFVK